MTTHIISALIVTIFFANTVIASAQVSSGDPAAAEQNAANIQRMTHRKIATRNHHAMPCTPPVIHERLAEAGRVVFLAESSRYDPAWARHRLFQTLHLERRFTQLSHQRDLT